MQTLTQKKPREHIIRMGSLGLSLEQAIALILGTGTHTLPVERLSKVVAQEIRRGNCTYHDLCHIPGVGPAKASALVGALALSRLVQDTTTSQALVRPERIFEECSDLVEKNQEHLVVFLLNVRNRLISRETITIGTATSSMVHPREVFREAILQNTHSLVLAHNHPSGDPAASEADISVTKLLVEAGKLIGIEVLDHVVCARSGWCSLREQQPALFQ